MENLEEQLARTKKELAEVKSEYQEFAYIVSHDLSAPFRSIEGFTRMIAEKHENDFDDKTHEYFNFINKSVAEGKNIVQSILQLSRLNTTAKTFSLMDCNELLVDIEVALSELIDKNGVDIAKDVLPHVYAEEKQLPILFYHLLKNALMYQKPGTQAQVTILVEEQKSHWQFCFKDNGIGIRDKVSGHVFSALRRCVGKEYPGEGMGLALAENIVRRHGGRIWFESVEGEGSTFYFTIEKRLGDD